MQKKTLLIIDSSGRDYGESGNFSYSIGQYNITGINNFRVNKLTIPYSWYNTRAQQFTINQGAGPIVLTMPAGSYTALSLAQTLQNLINTSLFATSITITYLTAQNKYEFIMSSGTITIDFLYSNVPANYNLLLQLGLAQYGNLTNPPNFSTLISPYEANLNSTSNIYLFCPNLNLYNTSIFNRKRSSVIQSIPVNVNSFNYLIWENNQQTIFDLDNNTIDTLQIQILDDYGNIIDFNGLNVIIEIQLYHT